MMKRSGNDKAAVIIVFCMGRGNDKKGRWNDKKSYMNSKAAEMAQAGMTKMVAGIYFFIMQKVPYFVIPARVICVSVIARQTEIQKANKEILSFLHFLSSFPRRRESKLINKNYFILLLVMLFVVII